jgi:hypothetical protein
MAAEEQQLDARPLEAALLLPREAVEVQVSILAGRLPQDGKLPREARLPVSPQPAASRLTEQDAERQGPRRAAQQHLSSG